MGPILDSSVTIAAERRSDTVQAFLQRVLDAAGDQEAALSPGSASWNSSTESTALIPPNAGRAVKASSRSFFPPSRSMVAAMKIYGVNRVVTFNTGDFNRYEGIQTIRPA